MLLKFKTMVNNVKRKYMKNHFFLDQAIIFTYKNDDSIRYTIEKKTLSAKI